MKLKTVIISVAVTGALVAGIGYGAYYSMQSRKKPVDVVPVANVNYGFWGDTSSMAGTIISKDTQTVRLDGEKTLVKVYVKEGDEVKIGDPLLEYDMTLTELQNEMEDLTKQTLELNLQSLQKDLEKWKKTSPTASLDLREDSMTASADIIEDESSDVDKESSGDQVLDTETGEEDPLIEPSSGEIGETGKETGSEDGQGENQKDNEDDLWDGLIEEGGTSSDSEPVNSEETLRLVNDFLTRINQLPTSVEELDQLYEPDVQQALRLFREKLSVAETADIEDVLGEKRKKVEYQLNPQVEALVGESTAKVLRQAYDRACVYDFMYRMDQIYTGTKSLEELDDDAFLALEPQIREALDAYYGMQGDAFEDYKDVLAPYIQRLSEMTVRLRDLKIVEETEPSTQEPDEEPQDIEEPGDFGDGDFGGYDGYDGYDGEIYTAQEIQEMIESLEKDIEECELDIRESELKLKQFARQLDNKIVRSTINGVVKTAGSVEENVAEENFIVITGAAGMYVKGSISELKLDTVSLGDTVQGISYDNGMSFTAEITEISTYPTSNNDSWYGSENNNASYYPFLAYIADAEGLEEGDVELQFVDNTPSTGIYLEEFFIRKENGNKKYVFIQGEDGLLKKQYVETGVSVYGEVEIKRGLSSSDKIAFPYGKDVFEGAATREVDNTESMYGAF